MQSEEGPARLQGVAVTSPAIKSVCKLFLAFVDGAQKETASPVLIDLPSVMTTSTADMIHWRPSPLPHQFILAQALRAKVNYAFAIINLKSNT